jgi:thiamine biosynthesis protein ThiS
MVRIEFNGQSLEVHEGMSIAELLTVSNVESRFCAVECNLEIVSKDNYASQVLRDGDRVEVVTLVGGG